MNRDWWNDLMQFVPKPLRGLAWVAGGFAADSERAGDVDIWILSRGIYSRTKTSTMSAHADWLIAHLEEQGLKFERGPVVGYVFDDAERRLVATIPHGFGDRPVQLLVTSATTPQELVQTFDLSVHQVAKRIVIGNAANATEPTGELIVAPTWSSLTEPIRVTRFTTPEDTLSRLHKLTQRYALQPVDADVRKLIEAIRAKGNVDIEDKVVVCGVAA